MAAKTEVQLYLEKAREALQQSQDNIGLTHYDVAILRAYYAMFYAANALLRSQGITSRKHSGVQALFAQHFVKSGLIEVQYSKMLGNAFDLRLDSDYEIGISSDESLANDVQHNAEQFVARAALYLQSEGHL